MALVLAHCQSGKAYVFRRNYDAQGWENVAQDRKSASRLHFVKQADGSYFIRVTPDDSTLPFEYPVAADNPVTNSGNGFLQVPLPDRQELYGIKFKSLADAERFYGKIMNELKLPYSATLPQGGIIPEVGGVGPISTPAEILRTLPDPIHLSGRDKHQYPPPADHVDFGLPGPDSMVPGGQPVAVKKKQSHGPAFGGMDQFHGRRNEPPIPRAIIPDPATGREPPPNAPQPWGPHPSHPLPHAQPEWNSFQPTSPPNPSPVRANVPPPAPSVHPNVAPLFPTPSPSQDISSMASFLMKAINGGNVEAAKEMVDILASLTPNKRKFTVMYDEEKPVSNDDDFFDLDIQIEFQASHRRNQLIYVPVKQDYTILDLQLLVENQFHLPRATQNWIIGPQLVKQTDLKKSLEDYEISTEAAKAGKAKVFLYVMNAKKANVPQGVLDAVQHRKQQQQEAARQGQSKEPWHSPQAQGGYVPGPDDQAHIYGHLSNRGYQGVQPMAAHRMPQPQPGPTDAFGYPQPHYQEYSGGRGRGVPGHDRYYAHQPSGFDAVTRGAVPGGGYPPPSNPPQGMPLGAQPGSRGTVNGFFHTVGGVYGNVAEEGEHIYDIIPGQIHADPGPPPAPPEEEEEEKIGWECPMCTFINPPRRPGCKQCGNERPADYVIPEGVPMDEEEAKIEEDTRRNEQLFHELQEQELRQQEQDRERNYLALLETEEAAAITNAEEFECAICYTPIEVGEGITLRGCLHQFCKECLHGHVINCMEAEVKCPFQDNQYACDSTISERELRGIVSPDELQDLYRRGLRQAENAAANSFHCRTPNCEGFCFYEDEVNEFNCPICIKQNCLLCKAIHEEQNCQEYQDDLKRLAANDAAAKATQDMLEELVRTGDAMNCPSCKIVVQKKDGCDWIRCSMCKTEICWATKGPRWGPKGRNDTSGGCKCRVGGKKCHPLCRNCH